MDPIAEFISLPFVQFWLAIICVSGILLVVVWSFILRRRSERRQAARQAEANAALAAVDPDAAPVESVPAGPDVPGRKPVEAVSGALRGAARGVRNFFFYTEEEKAALQTGKQPSEIAAASGGPAAAAAPALPHVSPPPDTAEVLHLWRDVADGSLIIQIGPDYYRTMGDITAAGQERRFMAVLRELARIAKETAGEVSAPPPAPAPAQAVVPPAQVAAAPTPPPPAAEAPVPAQEPDIPPMPPQPEAEAIVRAAQRVQNRPSLTADLERENTGDDSESLGTFFGNVRDAVKRGGRPPEKKPEPLPLTIADHIEEFLQARLRTASAELQNRRIHIRPALHGGVRIEVDGRFYEAVGDIEDEAVRRFVIDAIQGWEAGD